MTQISKLNYATKSNVIPIADRPTQATAEDFNEIKTTVNECVDGINWIKADEVELASGTHTVSFLTAYPAAFDYVIIVHNCYNSSGYLEAHTISNKLVSGFDVTVSKAVTLLYLAVPKR